MTYFWIAVIIAIGLKVGDIFCNIVGAIGKKIFDRIIYRLKLRRKASIKREFYTE